MFREKLLNVKYIPIDRFNYKWLGRVLSDSNNSIVSIVSIGRNFVYYLNVNPVIKKVRENVWKDGSDWVNLECLTTLYRALVYSPLSVTQIPTLFFLSETILYWLKNDAILEPFLSSTELKLLKVRGWDERNVFDWNI